MSMSGSKARLVGLTKELSLKWDETKNYWRDAKAQEFERKYLQELFIGVDKTEGIEEKLNSDFHTRSGVEIKAFEAAKEKQITSAAEAVAKAEADFQSAKEKRHARFEQRKARLNLA